MLKLKVATIGMVLGTLLLGTNAPARTNAKTSALEKWSFAGESYGVRIFFKINRECRESGSSVALKLENTLDYPVTVSFRVKDPEWSKSFERDLKAQAEDTGLKFIPETGTACHPYVDNIYVEATGTKVSSVKD
jgi:hypothetical protein